MRYPSLSYNADGPLELPEPGEGSFFQKTITPSVPHSSKA